MAGTGRKRFDGSELEGQRRPGRKRGEWTLRSRLREAERRLLVDVSGRWLLAGLAVGVFVSTVLVGVFGPASVRGYLLDGTSISDAHIELQPGSSPPSPSFWGATSSFRARRSQASAASASA